jgi:PAS domain S-box-containing protein
MEARTNIRALVIEDDREMANLLKRIIGNRFSMEVETAYDCSTARRKMLEQEYDIITLDYRLPDGAGLDLLDEITEGGGDHPPVIMVTGHGDEETAARSFRSRASGYVVKDAKLPEMLVDAFEKALAEISLKRIEKELLEEKVFVEDVLNGLPDLFAVVDTAGKFFRWNEKVSEVTGYTNAEISHMFIVDLFREEDRPRMLEGMQRLRDEGYAIDEVVLLTRSGEQRVYELCGRLLRNYDGIPFGYSGIGRDITDRVMAGRELARYRDELEEAVRERTRELEEVNARLELEAIERIRAQEVSSRGEAHFKSILEHSSDIISIHSIDGTILEISPSIKPLLGYRVEDMIGEKVFDFVHQDDFNNVLAAHNSIAGGSRDSNAVDCRFKHRDGGWHTLEVAARVFQSPEGYPRIIINARDVTRNREAQKALEESERRYRSFFTLSPDLIFVISAETGRIVDANEAMLRRSGLSVEELGERHHLDFFAREGGTDIHDVIAKLRAGEPVRGFEAKARGALGEELVYEVNAIPLIEDGVVRNVLGMARDITGRKRSRTWTSERWWRGSSRSTRPSEEGGGRAEASERRARGLRADRFARPAGAAHRYQARI